MHCCLTEDVEPEMTVKTQPLLILSSSRTLSVHFHRAHLGDTIRTLQVNYLNRRKQNLMWSRVNEEVLSLPANRVDTITPVSDLWSLTSLPLRGFYSWKAPVDLQMQLKMSIMLSNKVAEHFLHVRIFPAKCVTMIHVAVSCELQLPFLFFSLL